ncbi:MAG TPA: exosortase F system-associated protein [Cyclobacteriaceae bacterium]|nr:exosortase F system-associated protein [Cyclobacteriaceae bacterium]
MSGEKLSPRSRAAMVCVGLSGLVLVYVFQQVNYLRLLFSGEVSANAVFIFNRTFRLVINDLLCVILILGLFEEKKFVKMAFLVFVFELVVVLPLYFWIKLKMEGDSEISSPLLSQIHRLVVNPMLMFILMAGFYYQKFRATRR